MYEVAHPETGPETGIDTREMKVVHSYLRRELRLAGGLVRRVVPGDRARAGVVARHLDLLARTLHEHHTGEDDLLWPKLLERVPEELAPVVHLMEAQHEGVDAALTRIGELLPAWAQDPTAESGETLASLYDELYVGLTEHLDAEEERLLPLASRCLTKAEWDEIGERGRQGVRRSERALVFGSFQYEGDPEVIALMLAPAPPPVRFLVPRLARRAFRKHSMAVHGTPTP
jgi:hemerythrin-like domain-containing protein